MFFLIICWWMLLILLLNQRTACHSAWQAAVGAECSCTGNLPTLEVWSCVTIAQGTVLTVSAQGYHLPVGSSCWLTLPHCPAPPGEQRWLPAASMLIVVSHARCSSHWARYHRWLCIQFNCSSCMEQFANGSAVFWVTGHFSTLRENWTVRAFLQLTLRLSNDFTASWLTFSFPAGFCCGRNLEVYRL